MDEQIQIHVKILEPETDKAILVQDALGEEHWLPKSQIEIGEKTLFGNLVLCPRWLAEKRDIPYKSKV